MSEDILQKITMMPNFSNEHYVDTVYPKNQIFLHFTASDGNPFGCVDYWKRNASKVATAFIMARGTTAKYTDGQIFQCFPSNRAAWHLGVTLKHLQVGGPHHVSSSSLNFNSVGIEICNFGGLTLKNGKYWTYAGTTIPESDVYEFDAPYRGYKFYEKYTDAQLESVRQLLLYLCERYTIPTAWKGMKMFDVSPECLRGEKGIWAHVSVRPPADKQDVAPQQPLIDMLQSL